MTGWLVIPVFRVLCLLAEFEDVSFSREDTARYFDALLNQPGFEEEGATGSVRDYFEENSHGLFVPEFDVRGPVRLPEELSFYGKNVYEKGVRVADEGAATMVTDALALLEEDAPNLEEYDAIYVIYAGYDESQGALPDAIWAHQGHLETLDKDYACSAELFGNHGETLAGIGSVCHETGHLLGLPDLYDTNSIIGGMAAGGGPFSLMAEGGHNREDRQPPYMNALELYLLGWLEEIPQLPEGRVTLSPVNTLCAFQSPTQQEGEFFLFEFRSGKGWDAGLSSGLVIYHVDYTKPERWLQWRQDNSLNANAAHPCFYPIRSSAPGESLKVDASVVSGNIVFPGLSRRYCHEPSDWHGQGCGLQLSCIRQSSDEIIFYALTEPSAHIDGLVQDVKGRALQGAVITLQGIDDYAVSGQDGYFSLPIPEPESQTLYTLTATMADCKATVLEVSLSGERMASVPLVLHRQGEADETTISRLGNNAQFGFYPSAAVGAVRFSAQELAPYSGRILSEVTFYPYLDPTFQGELYVTVDIGNRQVLRKLVSTLSRGIYYRNTVDLSDEAIVVPEGEPVYIGIESPTPGQGYYLGTVYPVPSGSSFFKEAPQGPWKPLYVEKAGFYMDVALSALVKEQSGIEDLSQLGVTYIEDPGKGQYAASGVFPLRLVGAPEDAAVSWSLDGTPAEGESITLPKEGEHVLRAALTHSSGKKETLTLIIKILK